jgi:hypothetical protein
MAQQKAVELSSMFVAVLTCNAGKAGGVPCPICHVNVEEVCCMHTSSGA